VVPSAAVPPYKSLERTMAYYSRHLSDLISSLRRANFLRTDRRWSPRKSRFVYVDYVVRGRSFNDAINNISQGGACIRTQRPFRPGDDIALDLSRLGLKTHVEGRIAWTGPRSIGIEFRSAAADVKGVRYDFNIKRDGAMRTGKGVGMGKIRKRTVRWEPSDDAEKYRLYWSWKGPIGYESDFVEIGNKTMVILPDEVPSFPNIAGNIELGVTAINAAGNESDITVAGVYVDFTVPEAPKALRMED
jgi:hypothetical protein